jgi:hypothetical protein
MSKHAPFVCLVAAIIVVFYTGITSAFSSDDYVHLLNNTNFNNTFDALNIFLEPFGREYRPMVRISLWFNHLMGETAFPFKITNLLLHLIATTTIYIILNKFKFSRHACLIGAAIFGLHPIHVTSMHFILGRTDLVAAIFYFGTIALAADWKAKIRPVSYLITFLMFSAALLSKEVSITLPFLITVLMIHNQSTKNWSTIAHCIKVTLPFYILAILYLAARIYMWSKIPNAIAGYTNYNLFHVVTNYAQWFFGLIYPFDLYVAQDWMLANKILFVALASMATAFIAILTFKTKLIYLFKSFWFWFAIIWILVTLLPISGGNAHRWYLYIPSFGLTIIVAALIDELSDYKKQIMPCIGALLCVYAFETYRLSQVWETQSAITETILQQIEEKRLYEKEKIYVANIPFGFKSSYLFTFNSLEEAIKYRFGKAPKIEEINYMNLDENGQVTTSIVKSEIHFSLVPTPHHFMLLTALERRFDSLETRNVSGIDVKVNRLADNQKISDYTLVIPEQIQPLFYYFDQLEIKRIQ